MSAVMEAREPSAKYLGALQPPLVQHFELMATAPGGVAKLRELILTLAVQGKLVPQDPRDEPASELLKKIRAEKEKHVSEGKAKRGKPLAELTEEDQPFAIPRTWCWVRLGDITNYGSPVKAGALLPDTWVLDMEDIEKSSGRLIQKLRFIDRPALSDKNSFTKGDVLYGKLRPYLNKVLVADEDGVCTTEIIPFRCYGEYEPAYFRLALSGPYFLEYVNARSYGMKMPRLGTDDARDAALPLPPLVEQSRIVSRVEKLMRLCDALEAKGQLEAAQHAQLVQTLLGALTASTTPDEMADNWQRVATHFDLLLDRPEAIDALEQTILQLAVRGLLMPQDPKDEPASVLLQKIRVEKDRLIAEGKIKRDKPLPPITEQELPPLLPGGWECVRFGDYFFELCTGPFGSVIHKEDYVDGGVPLINPSHMIGGRISHDPAVSVSLPMADQLGAYRLTKGDVVLARRGEVGRYALVTEDEDGWLCGTGSFFVKLHDVSNRNFLGLILEDPDLRLHLLGESVGSTMTNLNQRILIETPIALPPIAEQSRIVARVESLRSLCADLRQRLAARQTTQAHLAEALIAEVA